MFEGLDIISREATLIWTEKEITMSLEKYTVNNMVAENSAICLYSLMFEDWTCLKVKLHSFALKKRL